MTGDPGLVDIDQFMIKHLKTGNTDLFFFDSKQWQFLTNKRTDEFVPARTLREKFGRLNILKSVLILDETHSALERSFKAATKLRREFPTYIEMQSILLMKLSSLAEDIHVEAREASQNTDLDIREFLRIDKAAWRVNTSKLIEINRRIKRDTKRSQEVENDPIYSVEERQLYKDRFEDLNTKKKASL